MHLLQESMAAHPSTALRLRERTRSNGGAWGDEALCRAWRDCKSTVKQVQEPPPPDDEALCLTAGRMLGVVEGLGKYAAAAMLLGFCMVVYAIISCCVGSPHGVMWAAMAMSMDWERP